MAAIEMRDVLERCRRFHHQLSEYYAQAEHDAQAEEVRAVLDLLAQHERRLEGCVALYAREANPAVLGAWFKVAPDDVGKHLLRDIQVRPDATVEEVLSLAQTFDQCLVHMYRELMARTQSDEVREALTGLLALEERGQRRLGHVL